MRENKIEEDCPECAMSLGQHSYICSKHNAETCLSCRTQTQYSKVMANLFRQQLNQSKEIKMAPNYSGKIYEDSATKGVFRSDVDMEPYGFNFPWQFKEEDHNVVNVRTSGGTLAVEKEQPGIGAVPVRVNFYTRDNQGPSTFPSSLTLRAFKQHQETPEEFDIVFQFDTSKVWSHAELFQTGKKEPQPDIQPIKPPQPSTDDVKKVDVTKEADGGGFAIPGIGAFAGGEWHLIEKPTQETTLDELRNLVGVVVDRSNEQSRVIAELLDNLGDLVS